MGDLTKPFCHATTSIDYRPPYFIGIEHQIEEEHRGHTGELLEIAWVREIRCYKTPVSKMIKAHHTFVILKIQHAEPEYLDYIDPNDASNFHWLSFEKNQAFIDIQWATDKEVVKNYIQGDERTHPVKLIWKEQLQHPRKVVELIKHILLDIRELKNTYQLLNRNCQQFTASVFRFCTGNTPEPIISSFMR